MSVPWRKINRELDAILFTSRSQFSYDITFTILIRRITDTILCQLSRPQAETVVMFGGKDYSLHAGSNECFHPLFTIQLCWIEGRRIRIPIPPLAVIKCIQTEMHKSISFHFLPINLFLFRYRKNRLGSLYCRLTSRKHGHSHSNQQKVRIFHIAYKLVMFTKIKRYVQNKNRIS